jgi:hypothetical protein
VLRYDTGGNVSFKGNQKLTCQLGGKIYNGHDSDSVCASLANEKGYVAFYWQPLVRKLNGGVARTLPAAAYVHRSAPDYNFVYIVGGFADAKKTLPLDRVDVFNIGSGDWAEGTPSLQTPRGAPLLGWSTTGAQQNDA